MSSACDIELHCFLVPRVRLVALGGVMPIYRLLQNVAFDPDDIKRMSEAYERALVKLAVADRNDPFTETVAQEIIVVAQTGEKDPERICSLAIEQLGAHRSA
jgi:hypothetical protein